jgi:hypothetical protein
MRQSTSQIGCIHLPPIPCPNRKQKFLENCIPRVPPARKHVTPEINSSLDNKKNQIVFNCSLLRGRLVFKFGTVAVNNLKICVRLGTPIWLARAAINGRIIDEFPFHWWSFRLMKFGYTVQFQLKLAVQLDGLIGSWLWGEGKVSVSSVLTIPAIFP